MTPEVKAGAELLDRVRPGWEKEINLGNFNISSGSRCILGQLYHSFSVGLMDLCGHSWKEPAGEVFMVDHGFEYIYKTHSDIERNKALTPHWVEAINERRNRLTVDEILLDTPVSEPLVAA